MCVYFQIGDFSHKKDISMLDCYLFFRILDGCVEGSRGSWYSTNPRNPAQKYMPRPGWGARNSTNNPSAHTLRCAKRVREQKPGLARWPVPPGSPWLPPGYLLLTSPGSWGQGVVAFILATQPLLSSRIKMTKQLPLNMLRTPTSSQGLLTRY